MKDNPENSHIVKSNSGDDTRKAIPKARWKDLVGSSTFLESRNLAPKVGVEKLFLKFEGGNPTGTQKDRIALALAEDAWKKGTAAIVTATCGNYGAALAYAAKLWQLPAHIYIPKEYHVPKDRMKRIQESGAVLHFEEGQYEDLVYLSGQVCDENRWYDANAGAEGTTEIALNAYAEIALEVFRDIRRAPDFVFCPVGNGTTLAGIYQGFKSLVASGKTMKVPRMVATSTRRGNAIVKSYKMRSRRLIDLSREEIKETKINEPLTNWHSFDGQEALDAIYESDGFADYASEVKMVEFSRLLREEEGLNVLPAAASTLAVMSDLADSRVVVKGTFLAILTGRDF
ncbi:MAG: pyridoxal-phosphate dependent enzyme [Candidatus Thorarchaeota archaeon]|nr:pyridoxal-phosphate dependent enzyme [Candidatus Thorarchaeota archaeon]